MNMKKLLLGVITSVFVFGAITLTPMVALAAPADSVQSGINAAGGDAGGADLNQSIKNVVNILLYILGAIAVIMIIIGGIRYATANGESGNIKSAKDTILYAVIGLIVAIMAYAIVNFVVGAFAA
jgi:hypothetical protein